MPSSTQAFPGTAGTTVAWETVTPFPSDVEPASSVGRKKEKWEICCS